MEEFTQYLLQAISSFDNDPPASKFQEGYFAALRDVAEEFLRLTEDEIS